MSLKDEEPTKTTDVRGEVCPYPILETKMALKSIDSRELLEVLLDAKPSAEETLPSYCKKLGYDYEVVEESGYWRFFIKKA